MFFIFLVFIFTYWTTAKCMSHKGIGAICVLHPNRMLSCKK